MVTANVRRPGPLQLDHGASEVGLREPWTAGVLWRIKTCCSLSFRLIRAANIIRSRCTASSAKLGLGRFLSPASSARTFSAESGGVSFVLNDDQKMIQDMARQFAADVIIPQVPATPPPRPLHPQSYHPCRYPHGATLPPQRTPGRRVRPHDGVPARYFPAGMGAWSCECAVSAACSYSWKCTFECCRLIITTPAESLPTRHTFSTQHSGGLRRPWHAHPRSVPLPRPFTGSQPALPPVPPPPPPTTSPMTLCHRWVRHCGRARVWLLGNPNCHGSEHPRADASGEFGALPTPHPVLPPLRNKLTAAAATSAASCTVQTT